jgi:predicted metal-dependent hydrolase
MPESQHDRPPAGAASVPASAVRSGLVRQGDRDKAFRPLDRERRRAAFEAGLAAYQQGDFFAAHEALEPAWMGTDDLAERALHQGLIKVAAAGVHAVRGNPAGVVKNLTGARRHLDLARSAAPDWDVDLAPLIADIDARLAAATMAARGPAPRIRRITLA